MSKQTELTDAEMLRYARQILLEGWDIEAQTRLKNSCAIIIGTVSYTHLTLPTIYSV